MRTQSSNIASETSLPRWDFSSMICCDPDELQYGKQINDSTWEFVQVTHPKLYDLYSGAPELFCEAYDACFAPNSSCVKDAVLGRGGVVWSVIDLNEYNDEQIEDYICCYGYTLKENDSKGRTPIEGTRFVELLCKENFSIESAVSFCEEKILEKQKKETLAQIKERLKSKDGSAFIVSLFKDNLLNNAKMQFTKEELDEIFEGLTLKIKGGA